MYRASIMDIFTHPDFDGHEQVVFSQNGHHGLRSIIAIHDTTLGPALGGCRIWDYETEADALCDVQPAANASDRIIIPLSVSLRTGSMALNLARSMPPLPT